MYFYADQVHGSTPMKRADCPVARSLHSPRDGGTSHREKGVKREKCTCLKFSLLARNVWEFLQPLQKFLQPVVRTVRAVNRLLDLLQGHIIFVKYRQISQLGVPQFIGKGPFKCYVTQMGVGVYNFFSGKTPLQRCMVQRY